MSFQSVGIGRSIPAHAGEPPRSAGAESALSVYPRPRGGTTGIPVAYASPRGLSPPTRGNPHHARWAPRLSRSIPAHAGEPAGHVSNPAPKRVYPRPRGGTVTRRAPARFNAGLSPPTRGNRVSISAAMLMPGSIPAHAGEPRAAHANVCSNRVYPRPRGGTRHQDADAGLQTGLSPPTRGNRGISWTYRAATRSIPAHAGEPYGGADPLRHVAVYPRPRGGTDLAQRGIDPEKGLSPPTRGNPTVVALAGAVAGSIPAHAGEPLVTTKLKRVDGVYPRPRGGTVDSRHLVSPPRGLSPPTRGNRRSRARANRSRRSIPAHAGEPTWVTLNIRFAKVYPRPRGGTRGTERSRSPRGGLSPPTRGNPGGLAAQRSRRRSIPAHAGEPSGT